MPDEPKKPLIVISCAHADEPERPAEGEVKWLSFVTGYLRPAIKHGAVELWIEGLCHCRRFRISMKSTFACTFESTRRPISTRSTASSKRMCPSMRAKSSKAICHATLPVLSENGP